jgi:hypothetical protein
MVDNIVTWRLKAGMVESEKTAIARQRLLKHVPAATKYWFNGFGSKAYPW